MDAQKVGRRIQEMRKARGLTQAELSLKVDLSTKYISNIECGFKIIGQGQNGVLHFTHKTGCNESYVLRTYKRQEEF